MIQILRSGPYGDFMARPSILSLPLVESICAHLEAGEPLAAICRRPNMPGLRTFLGWADRNEEVAGMYSRARDAQGEQLDAEIDRIAKTATEKDSAAAARVQISALQWRAAKMAPKRYGERVDVQVERKVDLASAIEEGRKRAEAGRDEYGSGA